MTKGWFGILAAALVTAGTVGSALAQAGGTLATVQKRGELVCGVSTGVVGFSATDSQGKWAGLDVDVYRGAAAAIFGSGDKAKFLPSAAQQRFPMPRSAPVDMRTRSTTPSRTR